MRRALALMLCAMTASANAAWKIERKTSPMDDSVAVHATVSAKDASILARGNKPVLGVRCIKGEPSVVFITGAPFKPWAGDNSASIVGWRFDSETADSRPWTLAEMPGIAFFPDDVSRFVVRMQTAKKLAIEWKVATSSDVAEFDVSGLDRAIADIKKACPTAFK